MSNILYELKKAKYLGYRFGTYFQAGITSPCRLRLWPILLSQLWRCTLLGSSSTSTASFVSFHKLLKVSKTQLSYL